MFTLLGFLRLGAAALLILVCFSAPAAAQPLQDTMLYTAPAGTTSALGGPTPNGEISILREQSFEATPPDVTGSGVTLTVADTDRDGLFSQVVFVRTGPVATNTRDPESEGAIVFPASVTVIGVVDALGELVATDTSWGLAPSVDYTASARGMEGGVVEYARIVNRADGTTAVELRTNMNVTPFTDEFRILIDHGTAWVPNLVATVEVTTGDDVNIGSDDGGRTGTPTSYTSPLPLTGGCGNGTIEGSEACDGGACCTASCTFAAAGFVCGAATPGAACDAEDVCTGSSALCPDAFLAGGTVCRAVADVCDVAELCDGAAAVCPTDGFEAMGTPCRASTGSCDPEEACSGAAAACPTDMVAADGTSCADAIVCDGTEMCSGGVCGAGTALDCDDADACTTDMCAEPGGCSNAAVAGCCNVDGDCDDSNVCTVDTCGGPGGSCGSSPITDCCLVDADCDDMNACTADACDVTTNRCTRAPVAGCCTTDADCGDLNACTTDTCDVGTGACANAAIPECCATDGDCDDGNTCTLDACDASTSMCANDAIAGCCVTDVDCDDMDLCTTDMCNTATASCSTDRIPGCTGDGGVGLDDAGVGADAGGDVGGDGGGFDGGGGGLVGDAGTSMTAGGCGCHTLSSDDAPVPLAWLLALGGLVLRRRRS